MAIVTIEIPKEFNYAQQTIPFVVNSSLINATTSTGIDPLESAFRYIFELEVLSAAGLYKTYANIAIPPRPDNFYGFIDVAPMILDALKFDLGTHLSDKAVPCPNSIIEFRLWCSERYLDNTGEFTTTGRKSLGWFTAIDAADNAPIEDYLIDSVALKKPLHHHDLCGPDLKVKSREPFTLSWLSKNDLGVNELEYIHGNYGNFNDALSLPGPFSSVYTGIEADPTYGTIAASAAGIPGPSLVATMNNLPAAGGTRRTIFKFKDVVLAPSQTYQLVYWVSSISSLAPIITNFLRLGTEITGSNFNVFFANNVTVLSTWNNWQQLAVWFQTTPSYSPGDIEFNVVALSTSSTVPLNFLNGKDFNLDSASLFETGLSVPYVSDVDIITDDGTVHTMPPAYVEDIVPLNSVDQSRFDTPVGPYGNYLPAAQDPLSGFWTGIGGAVAKWYRVRVKNALNWTIGLSEKIYQDQTFCEIKDNFRLKWKNKLGGWDYFTFTKVSKARTSIERENFKRTRGIVSSNGYSEATNNRGYQSLNIKLEDTYTVISDWVEDGTAKWLQDLFTSDEVYLLDPEPFQTSVTTTPFDLEWPVFVKQGEVEYQNNSIEAKLKNFIVEVTPAMRFEDPSTNYQ